MPYEDYQECLFHTKELLRLKIVAKEMKEKNERAMAEGKNGEGGGHS
jgi:hypothetical protein